GRHSAQAADAAEGRRHPAAGYAGRCAGGRALRQRHPDRGADGPGRRPRRDPRRQAITQTEYNFCHVREGRRANQDDGGPMSHSLGVAIESLVAVLLMLTIGYCMLLNKRLKRLKADEQTLKATIGELITATEIAEGAIGGLKNTGRDGNENLNNQLTSAGQMSLQLKKQLAEGDNVVRRLSKIAGAGGAGRRGG